MPRRFLAWPIAGTTRIAEPRGTKQVLTGSGEVAARPIS